MVLLYLVDVKNGRRMDEKWHRIEKTGENWCSGCGKLSFREALVGKTVVDCIFGTHLRNCLPTKRFSALVLPSYRKQFDFRLLFFPATAVEMFWGTILRKVKMKALNLQQSVLLALRDKLFGNVGGVEITANNKKQNPQ